MSRRKAAGLLGLLSFLFLAGCHTDMGSTVSWSPDGGKVAFLADGAPWVYDLLKGRAERVAFSPGSAQQIAWSPRGDRLAVSTGTRVELFSASGLALERAFDVPSLGAAAVAILSWRPSGERLLLAQIDDSDSKNAYQTHEIFVSSGAVDTEPGLGFPGPGGGWTLWMAGMSLGHDDKKTVFAREDSADKPLPIAQRDLEILQADESLAAFGDPLCVTNLVAGRTKVYCFPARGPLRLAADLPKGGVPYPDRRRALFAVMDDDSDHPSLSVLDAKGRLVASGERFLDRVRAAAPSQGSSRSSNLVWSPDGNWLAWVYNGRLCLWNWRNDVTRVLPKLD